MVPEREDYGRFTACCKTIGRFWKNRIGFFGLHRQRFTKLTGRDRRFRYPLKRRHGHGEASGRLWVQPTTDSVYQFGCTHVLFLQKAVYRTRLQRADLNAIFRSGDKANFSAVLEFADRLARMSTRRFRNLNLKDGGSHQRRLGRLSLLDDAG